MTVYVNFERSETLIYSRVKLCSPEFKSVVEIRNLTNHSSTNIEPPFTTMATIEPLLTIKT